MAIQLDREIRGTGFVADYWALTSISIYREGNTNSFTLSGTYGVWKDAAEYSGDGNAVRGVRAQVNTGTMAGNPTAGAMQAALDAAAVADGGPLEGGTIL